MSAAPAVVVSGAPKAVDIDAIERELAALWPRAEVGEEETVTRACMSNLLIVCTDPTAAAALPNEVAVIVQRHPSRVLLLTVDANVPGAEIEAFVSAQCYLAGAGRQVCSEHVAIRGGSGAAARLPSVARPLLIGDVPTALWWASDVAPPRGGDLFVELSDMAEQVVYDSATWGQTATDVVATAKWADDTEVRLVADLAWHRLDPWRRLLSQSLDAAATAAITAVAVEHGPLAGAEALLLIGWLADRLGWSLSGNATQASGETAWRFRAAGGEVRAVARARGDGARRIDRVSVTSAATGAATTVTVGVAGPGRLGVSTETGAAPQRILPAAELSRAALVAEQLPDRSRDPLFREALRLSGTMAEALA